MSPTSIILRSKPIFQVDLRVFLRALWFWLRSTNNFPNKFRAHSSNKSGELFEEIKISSSSSLVSYRFFRLSTIECSMAKLKERNRERKKNSDSNEETKKKTLKLWHLREESLAPWRERKKLLQGRETKFNFLCLL